MPFSTQFDDLFENCIRLAAENAGARAERVDKQLYKDKDVLDMIRDQIDKAAVLVAVITGNRPNVFYEIGLAHAVQKYVVILTNNTKAIPFDLQHIPTLPYNTIDDELVAKLTEQLKWHLSHPTTGDKYYQAFKSAYIEVESFGERLVPFFMPIANRFLSEWTTYIKKMVTDGILMTGPERLEITQSLAFETKKYSLIEGITGNLVTTHSHDWLDFYNQIGKNNEIKKTWILFVEMNDVKEKLDDIEGAWRFFHENNFETLYCSPSEFKRSTGGKLPVYQVIENFGEYVKLLLCPERSYTAGESPNTLNTTIRESNNQDQRMLESITRCASTVDEEWFKNVRR
jgi:hypothetical protein